MNTLRNMTIIAILGAYSTTFQIFTAPGEPIKESVNKFLTQDGKFALGTASHGTTDTTTNGNGSNNKNFYWRRAILKGSLVMTAFASVYLICKITKESKNKTIKSIPRYLDLLVLIDKARSIIK